MSDALTWRCPTCGGETSFVGGIPTCVLCQAPMRRQPDANDLEIQTACPDCPTVGLAGTIDTATALYVEREPLRTVWHGVRCAVCGSAFTVEAGPESDREAS